ncbi:hypothetical protein D3C78_774290 [compost metagenome]
MAEQLDQLAALVVQQLAEAVAGGELQGLVEAGQGGVLLAAVALQGGIEQPEVELQAEVALRLGLFAQVGEDLPGHGWLAKMALHPGIGQPFVRHQVLAVVTLAPVPFLQPEQDEVLVALAHGQTGAPGAGQSVQTELAKLAGHAPRLVPARLRLGLVTEGVVQAGLVMQYLGQGGRVGKAKRLGFRLGQALPGLFQMVLLGERQSQTEVVEQLVEVARGGSRRLALQGEEAAHGRLAVALGQFDLPQQQMGDVDEAAEAELVELAQCLLDIAARGA